MTVEENLKAVDVFLNAFNERDWDRVANLHAESVVYWTPDNPEPKKGRKSDSGYFRRLHLSVS